ncbi:MAG: PAS domain S-box protein [Chloroflexi bacterium]|nr:PAS domain S-box protein [Chloroflexota bacterium]
MGPAGGIMDYSKIKKAQLIEEIETLQERIAKLGWTQAERKRSAEALRKSEEKYRNILESIEDGYYEVDIAGNFTFFNDALCQMLGYSRDEMMGMNNRQYMDKENAERVYQTFNRVYTTGVPDKGFDWEIIRKDGAKTFVEASASLIRNSEGEPIGFRGIARDVTERKRMEGALEASEERYRSLFEHVPVGLYRTTPAGQVLDVNPALVQMLGYPDRESLLAVAVTDGYVDPEERTRWQALIEREGVVRDFEVQWRRHDGTIIWVRENARVVQDDEGQVLYYEGAVEDITERKQRAMEVSTMLEVTKAVSSTLHLEEVLTLISERMVKAMGVDGCALSRWDQEADAVVTWIEFRRQDPKWADEPGTTYALDDFPATRAVLETRQPLAIHVSDPDADPAELAHMRKMESVSLLMLPLAIGDQVVGLVELDQSEYERVFTAAEIRLCQTLANQAAIAIQNARLFKGIQNKAEELALLLDTATTVSSTLELDQALSILAEKMTTSVGATFCRIALLDEINQTLTIQAAFAAHELDWDQGLGRQVALADAPWHRRAIETNEVIILRQDDPPQAVSEPECRIALSEGIQSALLIPLAIGERALGVVSLGEMRSWERLPFTADRVRLCRAMANQAAIAIENARLLDAINEHRTDLQKLSVQLLSAQEEERRRLSLELHDELGQALTAISFDLAAIEKELPPEPAPRIREILAETSLLVNEVDDQVRELALDLRPYMLDDLGLVPALRWYVNRYARRLNIEVEFEAIDVEERLPADMKTALYRVVQEALTNVSRHAQANRVSIRLERQESAVVAFIEDDGQGFDVGKMAGPYPRERGAGLLGIRERVTSLGGRFDIESHPGHGTRLTIEIPV